MEACNLNLFHTFEKWASRWPERPFRNPHSASGAPKPRAKTACFWRSQARMTPKSEIRLAKMGRKRPGTADMEDAVSDIEIRPNGRQMALKIDF